MAGVDPDAAVEPARSAPEPAGGPCACAVDAHRAGRVARVGTLPAGLGREASDDADDGGGSRREEPSQAVGDLGGPHAGREHEIRARARGRAAGSGRRVRDQDERDLLGAGLAPHGRAETPGSSMSGTLPARTMRSGRPPQMGESPAASSHLDDLVANALERALHLARCGVVPRSAPMAARRPCLRSPAAMCSSSKPDGIDANRVPWPDAPGNRRRNTSRRSSLGAPARWTAGPCQTSAPG